MISVVRHDRRGYHTRTVRPIAAAIAAAGVTLVLAGCQLPFNSSAAAPGSTRNVAEQEAVAGSVAAGSTATTGVDEYGVARSRDSLVLTQNSRVVLRASDQSCRSGKKFVSIQTTGYGRSPWLAVFVRSYSVTEPQVEFPAMARDLVERIPAGTR